MGLFHCPLGVAFYDDEGCILCEMCSATNEEEMIEASKKIRAYLRSIAPKNRPVKKIAVCGKGGVGKSTIVTLMANVLTEEGYSVLVMDTDESNPGLYLMFGFENGPKPLITLLSRFAMDQEGAPGTEWLGSDSIGIMDIPSEYILNRDGLKFLMVGKIEDPFQGCACSMADITRNLMEKLSLGEKEIVLIDMEAGVESFGRGMERGVDTILMIVEPSFESITLAEKIAYMAEGMGVQLRVEVMPFHELLDALEAGTVDMVLSGMTITPERNQKVAFVGPYFVTGKSFLTKTQRLLSIKDPGEINQPSTTLVALKGSTSQLFVQIVLPRARLITANDYDEAVNMVIQGTADAMVADFPICAVSVFRYLPKDEALACLMTPLTYEPIGIAMHGSDPHLINWVQNLLNTLEANGEMKELYDKWFRNTSWLSELP